MNRDISPAKCSPYSPPCPLRRTLAPYIKIPAEALRTDPRGSQRVLEVCSPSILDLVRKLMSPTSTPPETMPAAGAGHRHRPFYLELPARNVCRDARETVLL